MKKKVTYIILLIWVSGFPQKSLSKLLQKQNTSSIPYISVKNLATTNNDIFLLDSREAKEYNTSHLKNAICVGYDAFKIDTIKHKIPNKASKIVVYCSLGIRSEDIGEKLKKAGYTNVFNLYGGIFEWKNQGHTVFNTKNKKTDSIHTFNKDWSKWLKKGIKVYD